jgi:ribosomal protein S18 acetylase RimI-like enzyme
VPVTPAVAEGLTVRRGTPDDLAALGAIESSVFPGDRLSRRSFRRLLSSPSAVTLVAVAEHRILGYAILLLRKSSSVARLYSLARMATEGNRGVGTALLEAVEREAAARGALQMRLELRPDNEGARALYERHGYVVFGRTADYYEDHADALRMRKSLIGAGQ